MSLVTKIEGWGNAHRPGWLDFFRIALGIFITYKGFEFMLNIEALESTTAGMAVMFSGAAVAHYIIFAHALGGPLLVFGLYTRIVSLIQVPILIGAVVFVNYPKGFFSLGNHMELEVSLIVLAGLIVFMVFGGGKFSVDEKRRKDKATA
ncbi:MAG TPA: DoxX family protein [Cyclobacteriaceae bacterium]|nr:DoxX family protein [Cyclobacteriaceae bacterium]MCB9238849.1 DoxX family protein [Flammeovirgaceae bacterium]MCB0498125.1 DoxX family protein [Cyclobacteriaceae bacterium]MCO5270568.1 DoxX family protein [Cyclobacteriaceae bacterium]MCW5900991.1 DoxX family protein [Cyclobacteriaceae bacterium]